MRACVCVRVREKPRERERERERELILLLSAPHDNKPEVVGAFHEVVSFSDCKAVTSVLSTMTCYKIIYGEIGHDRF